jgi:hypothetical protein
MDACIYRTRTRNYATSYPDMEDKQLKAWCARLHAYLYQGGLSSH